jgi:TatD DNase family protein
MSKTKAAVARESVPPPAPEPLPIPVADSHTHLEMQHGTAAEQVAAAAAVGVTTLIQVGTDVTSSGWSADLADTYPDVWATVALHPNEAPRLATAGTLDEALAEIEAAATRDSVVGVGETGLDYFRTGPEGVAAQQASFRAHIDIAKRYGRTLMIHDRDAHDDVLRILTEEGAPDAVVLHCYSGDAEMAKVCAERGYYLSFAGNVTYKANQHLRDALAVAPLDRVLVETDAPFLTPVPYRGRPNAPYLIPVTVRAMAESRGIDLGDLCAALAANTRRAYGLG